MKQFAIFKAKASVEKALKVEKELKQIDENFTVERTSSPAQVWATAPDYWPYGDSRFAAAEKIMARHFGPSQAAAALGSIRTPKKAASSRKNGKLGGRPASEHTKMLLKSIFVAIEEYNKRAGLKQKFIPSYSAHFDGRELRGLAVRGLINLTPQNNGSRDRRYMSAWYDIAITQKGLTCLDGIN